MKTVIKSAITTLVALLVITTLAYCVFIFFMPSKLVSFYMDMGENEMALKYQERVYEKDKTLNNLTDLINLAIATDDEEKIIIYVDELIKNYQFEEEINDDNYCDFIIFEYCLAYYEEDDMAKAINTANEYSKSYQTTDPLRQLAIYSYVNSNTVLAEEVLSALNNIDAYTLSVESQNLLQKDIANLSSMLTN